MKECKGFLYYFEKTGCLENDKIIARILEVEEQDANDRLRDDTQKVNVCDHRESGRYGRALAFIPRVVCGWRMSLCSSKEKFIFKPVYELDLSKYVRCTPSYRRLPKMFELDKLLESINGTIKSVEELSPSINAATTMTDNSFCVEDHLTDVMEVLQKNAPLALPVILIRLRQKHEEWGRFRSDFNKVWDEFHAKDYHKSLDHQSFYFKHQDTKNIIAEVPPERRERPGVFLQRNKTKGTVGDEIEDVRRSTEGLLTNNGLESKVDSDTMKVSYIAGSEDFMFRTRRRRKALYHKSLCSGSSNGSHKLKRKLMFS